MSIPARQASARQAGRLSSAETHVSQLEGAAGQEPELARTGITKWWPSLVCFSVVLLATFWVYRATVESLVQKWWDSETFAHCFLIVPICLFLVWRRRDVLSRMQPRPGWWGLLGLVFVSTLWLFAELADVIGVQQFAFVLLIPMLVFAVFGRQIAWSNAFPLAYLLFAVPFGAFLVPPLMDLTAVLAVEGLRLTRVPVYWEGRYISTPTGNWVVAEVCSGLRYLIASLALGCLYAYLTYRSYWKRLGFILLAGVVPLIANGIRAYGMILLGHLSVLTLAVGVDHIIYGWLFFGVVMFLLFWVGSLLRGEQDIHPEGDIQLIKAPLYPYGLLTTVAVTCLSLMTVALGPASATVIPSNQGPRYTIVLPKAKKPWFGPVQSDDSWRVNFVGSPEEGRAIYRRQDEIVYAYVVHYREERPGEELITAANQVYGEETWRRLGEGAQVIELPGGGRLEVAETRMRGEAGDRVALVWYDIAGYRTSSASVAKVLQAWSRLRGDSHHAAAVILAADYRNDVDGARVLLREFLGQSPFLRSPVLRAAGQGLGQSDTSLPP